MSDKKLILVVDDDPITNELLSIILKEAGYQVANAFNGQEGLDAVALAHPDLIISDVLMPIMDGIEFYKELKRDEITSHIPVLILTAREQLEDSFKAVGVNGFLPKPYEPDSLLTEVAKLLLHAPQAHNAFRSEVPLPEKSSSSLAALGRRVMVFGRSPDVIKSMMQQLEKLGCSVLSVRERGQIIPQASFMNPDLIFLQFYRDEQWSLESLLPDLTSTLRRKATMTADRGRNPSSDLLLKPQYLVLYSVDDMPLPLTPQDREQAIQRCLEAGCSKYLGVYSPTSFLPHILEFLV